MSLKMIVKTPIWLSAADYVRRARTRCEADRRYDEVFRVLLPIERALLKQLTLVKRFGIGTKIHEEFAKLYLKASQDADYQIHDEFVSEYPHSRDDLVVESRQFLYYHERLLK